jgi:hypothetical protein
VYRYDYQEIDHVRLLGILQKLSCRVVVSGYPSELYDEFLCAWQSQTFAAKAHDGIRQEKIWFNFDIPIRLHDTGHLGRDFRERQTIKRRLQRLQTRISTLSAHEQQILSEWFYGHLQEEDDDAGLLLHKR